MTTNKADPNTGRDTGRRFSPTTEKALKAVTAVHIGVYKTTGGKLGGRLQGSPVLLLETVGRKSGKRRTTPLLYLPEGRNMVIVASKGGAAKHPAWWLNLRDNPETKVQVGSHRLAVRAEKTEGEDRGHLWSKLVEMYPGYADYQRRTTREIPVVRLRPAG